MEKMTPDSTEAKALIDTLVKHHVAITSTLPVFESGIPGRPPLRPEMLEAMSAPACSQGRQQVRLSQQG